MKLRAHELSALIAWKVRICRQSLLQGQHTLIGNLQLHVGIWHLGRRMPTASNRAPEALLRLAASGCMAHLPGGVYCQWHDRDRVASGHTVGNGWLDRACRQEMAELGVNACVAPICRGLAH